ncbi:hypothetical protein EDM68_03000 [Candidatus Uhrbacteria bacterium]|nr:MAG: hypothetical protein EDM68_03000 [Candidatus Uhrbacteria bacterium]
MAHRQLFLTTTDLAATQAVQPLIRRMTEDGWGITVFVNPGSASAGAYARDGIPMKNASDYGHAALDQLTMRAILAEENPDLVLAGVASADESTDRLALEAACLENIPVAVILESYPGVWLSRYGDRDIPLYRRADALLVQDELSVDVMVKHGFDRSRVHATGNPAHDLLAGEIGTLKIKREHMRRDCNIPSSATVIAWFGTYDLDNPDHRGATFEGRFGFGEAEAYREYLEAIRDGATLAAGRGRVLRGLFRQKPTYGCEGIRTIERELETFVYHDLRKDGPVMALAASDLVCSLIGGTTLHQAAQLGVPGVFYQPGATPETDDQVTNALGITKPLYERGALRELILEIARDPETIPRLRRSLRPAVIVPGATGRVLEELGSLCF